VPPMCQHNDPAETPASTTPACQTATADPDRILVEQEPCHVLDVRHREQVQVHHMDPGGIPCFVPQFAPPKLVAASGSDVAQPWASCVHAGELDGMDD
jgi:hypothetical protein